MSSPQILTVDLGERSYDIQVGHGLLDENPAFQALARGRSVAVISDSNVDPIYGAKVEALLAPVAHQVVRIVVPAGEASKCWQQLDAIHDRMLEARLDRKSLIVALGGGVVGDLAGFAAASFQRGIDFVQVPTSLLAQVDSSVGGKTGINHRVVFAHGHDRRSVVNQAISTPNAYLGRDVISHINCATKACSLKIAIGLTLMYGSGGKFPMFTYRMSETQRHMALHTTAIGVVVDTRGSIGIGPFLKLIKHANRRKHQTVFAVH